jgi:hypothetical protein
MLGSLRDLKQYLGRVPKLEDALDYFDTTLDELLKRGLWTRLLADAGLVEAARDPDEERLAKGLRRLSHINCPLQIQAAMKYLERAAAPEAGIAEMLHVSLWGSKHEGMSLAEADKRLRDNPVVLADLQSILEYRLKHSPLIATENTTAYEPLAIHAAYTRDEILIALGHWDFRSRPSQREGVLHLKDRKMDVFFVTLQKSEDEYSPTTMYEDYLISQDQFHWQSQSNTSEQSPTGQRYVHHRDKGYTPLLFVRETKNLPSGLSAPYHFLGPCRYLSHTGSRPISIVWKLEYSVPTRLLRTMARQIAV